MEPQHLRVSAALFAFILFSPLACAACAGEITHAVVAVVGEGGGLVNITAKAVPGSGQDYLGILPYSGVSTQQSAKYAVRYARAISSYDTGDCDILLSFGELPSGEYVEGPSAGASIAVISYALFENLTVRNDAIVTGTLEPGGTVGAVGGLYEKARASAEHGMKYFITPFNNVYEFITLEGVSDDYGIKILRADSIDEIIGFMVYNKTINQKSMDIFQSRIAENMTPFDASGMGDFEAVAYRMIEFENYTLAMTPHSNDTEWVNVYFNDSISDQLRYLQAGYYFTAANDAFMNYIELSTINTVFRGDVDPVAKKNESSSCIASLQRPEMTEGNYEWVVGSDLRSAWARDMLDSVDIRENMLLEEKYDAYNSLMYADAWCRVAQSLDSVAEKSATGTKLNESAWKELADERIAEAELSQHSEDTASRLDIARKSYSEGRYGAAIIDTTYVIAMDSADAALLSMPEGGLNETVSSFSKENRTSLWGKVYQSQALFLIRQNEPQQGAAYRLFAYAGELDRSFGEMEGRMQPFQDAAIAGPSENEPWLLLISIFILFSFVLLFILPRISKRRSYGIGSKGYRGTGRTGQKKDRTGA
ncbi:hypothetical protein H0O02_05345 [Candidatus Micrarchaeota archaeon]|nr:hypothetical protein [Candidatus Micrarchaeota archaeon]